MLQLLISPKTVYKQTSYHRQTKGGWARDDPAFVVLSCGGVAALAFIYSLMYVQFLIILLSAIFLLPQRREEKQNFFKFNEAFFYSVCRFSESISTIFYFTISSVFIYYLGGGFVLATITWNVANKLLHNRSPAPHINTGTYEHTAVVDWPFCFDVYCNAMVPLVALLGGMFTW